VAVLFSLPTYVPDPTSIEVVTGYEVQSSSAAAGTYPCTGSWSPITGSPFTSPNNIVDTAGGATSQTWYRARPVRQANSATLDTPWSKPFLPNDVLFDFRITKFVLPQLRFVYLHDEGKPQSNGTVLTDTTGAGNGLWVPDGNTTRFPLQWVINDDPIRVLDLIYNMTWTRSGVAQSAVADQDYSVDVRNGVVIFKTAPLAGDYLRFDFRMVDFVNDDLLLVIKAGVNGLSHFGINGYQFNTENNLYSLNKSFPNPDLAEIVCKVGVWMMREGMTEYGLRSSFAWRDGGVNVDPYPSRALEFLVQKLQVSEKSIRNQANAWIRGNTRPRVRGDFDVQFDMSQMTPVTRGMFSSFSAYFGVAGAAGMGFTYPWWV